MIDTTIVVMVIVTCGACLVGAGIALEMGMSRRKERTSTRDVVAGAVMDGRLG